MKILILTLVVLAASYGQISLKKAVLASDSFTLNLLMNLDFLVGVALYGFCSIAWLWILKSTPLSQAYPVLATTFVFVPILSMYFFDEAVTPATLVGAGLILVGVLIVARDF